LKIIVFAVDGVLSGVEDAIEFNTVNDAPDVHLANAEAIVKWTVHRAVVFKGYVALCNIETFIGLKLFDDGTHFVSLVPQA
jgi:hypothetical protein